MDDSVPAADLTDDELYGLLRDHEVRWRDRQPFLESRGYLLRPRYRPGWIPSWRTTGQNPLRCEDAVTLPLRDHLIDATRISDGTLVYLKRVVTGDNESTIAALLSSEPLRHDSRNHSVPILDYFQDDEDPRISYMVMPFLRLIDHPEFELAEEIIDFTDQILEGLVFMHENGVAHRDCTYKNLMMDASAMYPRGFHPVRESFLPDRRSVARPLPRSDVGVTYYFVDFGISSVFNGQRGRVVGTLGRDQEVPELSLHTPYDPFKVDVFIIGNLLRREFHDKISNVEFLSPLIQSMTCSNPDLRPDAMQALEQWQKIRRALWSLPRRWRLRPRAEPWIGTIFFDTVFLFTVAKYFTWKLFKRSSSSYDKPKRH